MNEWLKTSATENSKKKTASRICVCERHNAFNIHIIQNTEKMKYYYFNNGDLLELPLFTLFKQTISIFNLIKILCGHDGILCS